MALAYGSHNAQLNSYRTNSVMGLTPGQLILKMYDMAVAAVTVRDERRVSKVLAELIECLDFKYDVATGLFRLYRYCMEEVKKGEYEVPARILRELREAWAKALVSMGQAAV